VLFGCAFALSILLPLKGDGALNGASWWAVFAPLWVLDALVFVGCAVGCSRWRQYRGDAADRYDIAGMVMCTILVALLFVTEVLICVRAEGVLEIDWRVVFTPTYIATVFALVPAFAQRLFVRKHPSVIV